MFNLQAANTYFQPKRGKSNATYLACTEGSEEGMLQGREVIAKYKGNTYHGNVGCPVTINGERRWPILFEDSYFSQFRESVVRKWMLPVKKEFVAKQIDYVFISNRWRSSITDNKVRWGPSIHRNKTGPADHALVECTWSWRIRNVEE